MCCRSRLVYTCVVTEQRFDVDAQAAHLFKHPNLGFQDVLRRLGQRPTVLPGKAAGARGSNGTARTADPGRCVDPSAGARQPLASPTNTGETDDQPHHDP